MAGFLRNLYEIPDEYTRAQAMEQQEMMRQQQQALDPRALVEAARNPMARGIVMPIIWNPQVGPDWFPKSAFTSALESVKQTEMARKEAIGTTSRMIETINSYGNEAIEFVKNSYKKRINKIAEDIQSIEDPIQRHFATKEAMFELSDLFDNEVAPFYSKYLEHDKRADILVNQGAIKNKNEYFNAVVGTTFNLKNSAEVANMTPEEEETLVRNISTYFSQLASSTTELAYNVTQMSYLGALSLFTTNNQVDLYNKVYHDVSDDLKKLVAKNPSVAPINVVGKNIDKVGELTNISFLIPTVAYEIAKGKEGRDQESINEIIDKLNEQLSQCSGEDCLSALKVSYDGEVIDFSPLANILSQHTNGDIIKATTKLRGKILIPEQYDGNPDKIIEENKDILKTNLYSIFYDEISKKVEDDEIAKKLADEYSDAVIEHIDEQRFKVSSYIQTIYDVRQDMVPQYSRGGGGGGANVNITNLEHNIIKYKSPHDLNSYPAGASFPMNSVHSSGTSLSLYVAGGFPISGQVDGLKVNRYDVPTGQRTAHFIIGYIGNDGLSLNAFTPNVAKVMDHTAFTSQGLGQVLTIFQANPKLREAIFARLPDMSPNFGRVVNQMLYVNPETLKRKLNVSVRQDPKEFIRFLTNISMDKSVALPMFKVSMGNGNSVELKYENLQFDPIRFKNRGVKCDDNENKAVCRVLSYMTNFVPFFTGDQVGEASFIFDDGGNNYIFVFAKKNADNLVEFITPIKISKSDVDKLNKAFGFISDGGKSDEGIKMGPDTMLNQISSMINSYIGSLQVQGKWDINSKFGEELNKIREYINGISNNERISWSDVVSALSMLESKAVENKPLLDVLLENAGGRITNDDKASIQEMRSVTRSIEKLSAVISLSSLVNTYKGAFVNHFVNFAVGVHAQNPGGGASYNIPTDDGRYTINLRTSDKTINGTNTGINLQVGIDEQDGGLNFTIDNSGNITISGHPYMNIGSPGTQNAEEQK